MEDGVWLMNQGIFGGYSRLGYDDDDDGLFRPAKPRGH